MGSQFLKSFAFGLGQEIDTLGQLAFAVGTGTPVGGEQEQPQQPQQPQLFPMQPQIVQPPAAPSPADDAVPAQQAGYVMPGTKQEKIYQGLVARGLDPVFVQGLLPNIGDESGWDGDIQERRPISGRGGRGYIQWTGPRREEFERRYGEDGYTDENQMDFLAWEALEGPERPKYEKIVREAGGDSRRAAAGIAMDFLRPADKEARARRYMSGMNLPSFRETEPSVDVSEFEEDEPDMSPEKQRRRHIGAVLMALGKGFGQMSQGQPVDISDVMEDYLDRQMEMKERMQEINAEKRRQIERREDTIIGREDQDYGYAMQEEAALRSDERREAASVRQDERDEAKIEKTATRAAELYGDLLPNADDFYRVGGMDAVKDAADRMTKQQQRAQLGQSMADLASANPNNPIYKAMASAMQADPSLSMKDAHDMFEDDDPTSIQEFKTVSKWPEEAQREYLEFKKGSGQTINLGDTVATVAAKAAFEELGKDSDAVRAEQPAYQAYKVLADVYSAYPGGELPTGAMEGLTLDARRYMDDAGLLNPDDSLKLGLQMTVNSLGNRLIGSVRIPGTGSTSDLEFTEFMKSIPNVTKPAIVNKIMTQVGINNYRYKEQVLNLKREHIHNNNGSIVGFDKVLAEAEQNGTVQASFYSATTPEVMATAIQNGNLKVGDLIKTKDGFRILDQNGIDKLMSEE